MVAARPAADTGRVTDTAWTTGLDGTPGTAMAACLAAAVAAPSIHNTQPWLFRPRGTGVDLIIDRRRHLDVTDPDGREMHISVGAALFNLRVAMLARGREPLVGLLPDPNRPDLAATVEAGPATAPDAGTRALAEAVDRRHTNRGPFWSRPVPDDVLTALGPAAHVEGGHFVPLDPTARTRVLDVVRRAEVTQRADPRYRAELADWTADSAADTDGVPPQAFGPRPELAALPVRDFDPGRTHPRRVARFESEPTIAVLCTRGDDRADWLRAGQALERVLLTATVHGLVAAPLTQAIAIAELRGLLSAPGESEQAQSVLRLGYAARGRPAPRRPLTDFIVGPD
jgi:Nitroreductase family